MSAMQTVATLPDVQSRADDRELPIDAVGIQGVRSPVTVRSGGKSLPTIATLAMTVALPAVAKATHMSRFAELLAGGDRSTGPAGLQSARAGHAGHAGSVQRDGRDAVPFFVRKTAPVSGVQRQLDNEVCWRGTESDVGQYSSTDLLKIGAAG
jgi:GTP cyclohydrolase FolE2